MTLLVLNDNNFEPTDYLERKTVRAVIVNEEGKILLLGAYPLGGGVEEGESYEEALHREVMEEGGVEVEIIKSLGEMIGYDDNAKKKYLVRGYLCKHLKKLSEPTTKDPHETKYKLSWTSPEEATTLLQDQIDALHKISPEKFKEDVYTHQARIHNRKICLEFIKEAFQ